MVRYLETFFRHRLLFLVPIGLILLVSGAVVVIQPAEYTATTRLWVDRPALGPDDSNPFVAPSAEQASSLLELTRTRYFTAKVAHRGPLAAALAAQPIQKSGLSWLKAKLTGGATGARYPTPDEVDATAADIVSRNVAITAVGPQIVEISFAYGDPRIASGTAQAVVDQFLEETLASKKARSQVVADFYAGQLKGAQDALTQADSAVNQYLAQHPEMRSPTAVPDARLVQLQHTDQQARDVMSSFQNKIDQARLDVAALSAPGASGMRLMDAADVPAQAGVNKKLLVQALGAGLGLGLIVLVLGLLVLTLADTTLRRPEDVEQALGLRLAGAIPRLTTRSA
jgi:uncharacterized protein involved in exopolysaccharide biosynthesis